MKRYVAYTSDVEPEPDGPYVDERKNSVHVYLAKDVHALIERWYMMLNTAMSTGGDGWFEQVDDVTAEMEEATKSE